MAERKGKLRLVVILAGFLLFAVLLSYSLLKVRYDVSGAKQTELHVIEKSIPHEIERNQNGGLVYTDEAGVSENGKVPVDTGIAVPVKEPKKPEQKPCPT